MRKRKMRIDVMVEHGDKFYGQIVAEVSMNPVMANNGLCIWSLDGNEITDIIHAKFPTLKGRTDVVAMETSKAHGCGGRRYEHFQYIY